MVVLKLCSYERKRPPMSMVAADLNVSPSEIHAAIKRLQQARLLHGPEMQEKPKLSAIEEFLVHGVKYAFPAEHGQVTRGLPTSFAAPPLKVKLPQVMNSLPFGHGERGKPGASLSNLYIGPPRQWPSAIPSCTSCSPW
jgi:hypothetical protein